MTDPEARAKVALEVARNCHVILSDEHMDPKHVARLTAAFVGLSGRIIDHYLYNLFTDEPKLKGLPS